MSAFISICIPAYSRVNYLKTLLDSIAIQTYRDFEVIVTDDSPGDDVEELIKRYQEKFPLHYHRNIAALGTPANWNAAIQRANGKWIKLMHDDDWLATAGSLAAFADAVQTGHSLIFSGYTNVYLDEQKETTHLLPKFAARILRKEPGTVLLENFIGPPSVTMIHQSVKHLYDERLKWRVDTDLYATILKTEKFVYINEPLIKIGISSSQVTQSCINNPKVELPEGFIVLHKHGVNPLRKIRVYDAWWRLLRNMKITSEDQLKNYMPAPWPDIILKIAKDLSRAPKIIYRSGIFSKFYMALSFLAAAQRKQPRSLRNAAPPRET